MVTGLLLAIIAIAMRLVSVAQRIIPFQFDHAKDALEIMEFWSGGWPSLVGAVTSIPGVFNGPFWLWLATPLSAVAPLLGPTLTVVLMSGLIAYFVYKAWGPWAGLLWATGSGLVATQTSAWSPYLASWAVVGSLLILNQIEKDHERHWSWSFLLGFVASFAFHTQTAFAVIFIPLLTLILWLWQRWGLTWKLRDWLLFGSSIVVSFVPWFVFELRNNWAQTQRIWDFVFNYQTMAAEIGQNATGLARVQEIGWYLTSMLNTAWFPLPFPPWLTILLSVALVVWSWSKLTKQWRLAILVLPLGTALASLLLPSKSYYWTALLPVTLPIMAAFIKQLPTIVRRGLLLVWSFAAVWVGLSSLQSSQAVSITNPVFLADKEKAIQTVRRLADGQSFASYHFVSDIYDFPYLAIYEAQARSGLPKPVAMGYEPGVPPYTPTKIGLGEPTRQEKVFLIVERPQNQRIFEEWWGRISKLLVVGEAHHVTPAITVYDAVWR